MRYLSEPERKALLEACQASAWDRLYLLVLLAITTGARQGELLRLRWRDLDFQIRRAYVHQTKNGEPRVLPLTANVIELLQVFPRPLNRDTLLFRSIGDPGKPYEFRMYWNTTVRAAKLENFRFHDPRHTCAAYLAQNGASLPEIGDVLGHKQAEVTKRYSHLCVDGKQKLINRVLGDVK